jgi:hypothetical protein
MTSSCHRCLGLPTGLVPIGFQSNNFLVGLAWSLLCIWPNYLILCALMNLTISAPSIDLSISMLFRILHILSILTRPHIFLSIYLSKMRRFFHLSILNISGFLSSRSCNLSCCKTVLTNHETEGWVVFESERLAY